MTTSIQHLLNDYRSAAAALSEYRMKHFPHGTKVVVTGNSMSIRNEGSFERRGTVNGMAGVLPDCVAVNFSQDAFEWVPIKNVKRDENAV